MVVVGSLCDLFAELDGVPDVERLTCLFVMQILRDEKRAINVMIFGPLHTFPNLFYVLLQDVNFHIMHNWTVYGDVSVSIRTLFVHCKSQVTPFTIVGSFGIVCFRRCSKRRWKLLGGLSENSFVQCIFWMPKRSLGYYCFQQAL